MNQFEFPYHDFPDSNDLWSLLWNHIKSTCDKHFPVVSFRDKSKHEFIYDDLLQKMRARDKACKTARKSTKPEELQIAKGLRRLEGFLVNNQ